MLQSALLHKCPPAAASLQKLQKHNTDVNGNCPFCSEGGEEGRGGGEGRAGAQEVGDSTSAPLLPFPYPPQPPTALLAKGEAAKGGLGGEGKGSRTEGRWGRGWGGGGGGEGEGVLPEQQVVSG